MDTRFSGGFDQALQFQFVKYFFGGLRGFDGFTKILIRGVKVDTDEVGFLRVADPGIPGVQIDIAEVDQVQ